MNNLTVGAFEAKTKFSELLERVSTGGEEIIITKHEKPVARLVPFEQPAQVELSALFESMNAFADKHPLNPKGMARVSYRDLIDEGRKS
jgi:prevent-host-death family protein